jgi:hypothetical protein
MKVVDLRKKLKELGLFTNKLKNDLEEDYKWKKKNGRNPKIVMKAKIKARMTIKRKRMRMLLPYSVIPLSRK